MKIVFTYHAREQMRLRNIEEVWVREVVKYPDKTEKLSNDKYLARRKINGLKLEVIYLQQKYKKIITVYKLQ